jgi:hypothetical protein
VLNVAVFFAVRGHDPPAVLDHPDRGTSAADASPSAPFARSE